MLKELERKKSQFGPAELRLAEFTMTEPRLVTQLSLAALSQKVGVSEPTVIRFCRKLGCTGFPDFKLRLTEYLASGTPYVHQEVSLLDTISDICKKVLDSSISAIVTLSDTLDTASIERAIGALSHARRIDFFGTGPSSVIAYDAQQKFMFFDVPAVFHHDSHLQIMSAASLSSGDVAVCFSFTGQTVDIVSCATRARDAGATVVSVTRSDSALAQMSQISINVDTIENTFDYSPMTTRLAHLAVVDVLATAVAVRRGPGISDRIQNMKLALKDKRVAR
ncbi:SIS domain-containing protein [Aureimonas fodinaquatilis]|uniref:SIS domain-containing protein n=1 Tax=Aureimonas fodinaquatilis TaxID=2565783 RepID=A0A5B0DYT3_9HYPH|nr:SIS domain-containing protein [Aureimonas fodinaquatilis]KAA0971182.1 SIS domain-containing protein [Aureimonas fodinaquatilis]